MHLAGLVALGVLSWASCDRARIPARTEAAPRVDPAALLAGGTLVYQDDFERQAPGDKWKADHASWRIEGGWLTSTNPRNQGLWLLTEVPARARIEFDARSEPIAGKPFAGDIKCEAFAARPEHQAGYVLVNGGWTNTLDIIARLDEHGKDRLERAADPVEPSRVYRWAVVRAEGTITWFKDGKVHLTLVDAAPLPGGFFGFNNWEARTFFDNVAVYAL